MKATLEFDLPEDRAEYNLANKAGEMASAIWEIDNRMRSELKYGNTFKSVDEVCEWVRRNLPELEE